MEEKELRNNYVFTLVKFILFLLIFCFLVKLTTSFWKEAKSRQGLGVTMLMAAALSVFGGYVFLADLNDSYKKIQKFFFRTTFVACLLPSVLIVLMAGYFFIPKMFNFPFNRDLFVYLGGMAFTGHLIYVARETQGKDFPGLIHYFFLFSIFYILHLLLLGVYLKIGFNLRLGSVIIDGVKGAAALIQSLFTQFY